ncbi:MAG: hypothetical protein AAB768_02480, partial [Patescibacteria group bacterium]
DDYKYNGPPQEEIDRVNKEAALAAENNAREIAAGNAAAAAEAERVRAEAVSQAAELEAQKLKVQNIKAADMVAAINKETITTNIEGRCDGWANPGSEHRNAGNGCFFTCDAGNWKGPNRCDGEGNGLFQGDPSNLSPEEIAKAVGERQSEAYLTVLKQDGKMLGKDAGGNTIIIDDPNADPNRKTTTQIAEETASQRTAEKDVQTQIAIKEYETKVAAANRETNVDLRNQMLAEFALLYQNSVPAAVTNLAALDPVVVAQIRESIGGVSSGSGSGATAICRMLDKPGGTQLGFVPCDDTVLNSKKELYGTLYQYQALTYGFALTEADIAEMAKGISTTVLAKLARMTAARVDAENKILNSPILQVEDKDGNPQTLDFEANDKKNSGYLAIYCGGCGGFAADPKGPGCNAEIEAKKAAGTCSSDPPICKNPDGSLCAINKDNKAQYGTKSEGGVIYSYVPNSGWLTATQIATSELADPKKCVEKFGQYACDQISHVQDTNITAVNEVLRAVSSSQTIGMSDNSLTIDGIPLNVWIKNNAHLPLNNNDISILNNQANGIATQVYSFQEVSKSPKFKDYANCVKDNSESEKCKELGNELFKDTNYSKLSPENKRLILTNLAVSAGSQNPDRRADVFSFLGLSNTEISSANNQINQNVHIGDLASKYQSGQDLSPTDIDLISKYYDKNKLDENRKQNMAATRQNQINTASLNLFNAQSSYAAQGALSGLDAAAKLEAKNRYTKIQEYLACRSDKCTNLYSELQTLFPKDLLVEITKFRADQITFEKPQFQTTDTLPPNIQSAVDAKYDELVKNAQADKLANSRHNVGGAGQNPNLINRINLTIEEETSLRGQALADVLSQHPESVTLNPSTDQTGFQNYINNWKAEHPPIQSGRFGTIPAPAPPSIDQLKQDAIKFAVQTCATSNNLSACTQFRTLDNWGAYRDIYQDLTANNISAVRSQKLLQDLAQGKVDPVAIVNQRDAMLKDPAYNLVYNLDKMTFGFAGAAYTGNIQNTFEYKELVQEINPFSLENNLNIGQRFETIFAKGASAIDNFIPGDHGLLGGQNTALNTFMVFNNLLNFSQNLASNIVEIVGDLVSKPGPTKNPSASQQLDTLNDSFSSNAVMGGAIPAATIVAIVALPALSFFPAVGTLVGLSTAFGIYGTTSSLPPTAYYCSFQPRFENTFDGGACTLASLNTGYMALSTLTGVLAGANPAAVLDDLATTSVNKAITNRAVGEINEAVVNTSLAKAANATLTPIEKIIQASSTGTGLIGIPLFGSQALQSCGDVISGNPDANGWSCLSNAGMAIASMGRITSVGLSMFRTPSSVLTPLGKISGLAGEGGDIFDGVSSCIGTAVFNAGQCFQGVIDVLLDKKDIFSGTKINTQMGQAVQATYQQALTNLETQKNSPTNNQDLLQAIDEVANWRAHIQIALETSGSIQPNTPASRALIQIRDQFNDKSFNDPLLVARLLETQWLVNLERDVNYTTNDPTLTLDSPVYLDALLSATIALGKRTNNPEITQAIADVVAKLEERKTAFAEAA